MNSMDTGAPHNPFSSHLLEPGRGGYIFPDGLCLEDVIRQMEASNWRGELTGNHGAGKSTLLADLCTHLRKQDRRVTWWQSSDRQRLPPRGWLRDIWQADVIAYDGAERLLPGMLFFLRALTRALGRGLLVTTHWRHNFGCVWEVRPNAQALAKKFGTEQTAGYSSGEWLEKIESALARHHGNSRQVLFDLYMEYEDRARREPL